MIKPRNILLITAFVFFAFLFLKFGLPGDVAVSAQTESRLSHSGCVYGCLLDQYILGSESNFYRWYGTAYLKTGCNDSTYKSFFENSVSALSVAFNAPGGVKMSCWDMLLGQTKECANQCLATTPENRLYGPNVRVAPLSVSPGYLQSIITNTDDGYPPDRIMNTYSRKFYLTTTLTLNDGTPLVLDKPFMPYLSYPNWITQQNYNAYTQCVNAYGADDGRCKIISPLSVTDTIEWSVDFMDGALYDLSDKIDKQGDVSGSFANGFVVLEGNNDGITIEQGPYAGFYWEKTHNLSKNTHSEKIVRWDANFGPVTITNSECWYCVTNRTDRDTYVFALRGPSNLRLTGTYQVEMVADVTHDKDFSNNRFSYSYTDQEVGNEFDFDLDSDVSEGEIVDDGISLDSLPVIIIPGQGVYSHTLPEDGNGLMFRLDVPENIYEVSIELRNLSSGWPPISMYTNPRNVPQPFIPPYDNYSCYRSVQSSFYETCYFYQLAAGPHYFYVADGPVGASFQLEVNWVNQEDFAVTQTWRETAQAEYAQTQQALIRTFTEVEPNDSRESANVWDMIEPFTGELGVGDKDYILVTFQESGIYTFGVTEVSPQLKVYLGLLFDQATGSILRVSSKNVGEGVSMTLDASAGETFYFMVAKNNFAPAGSYYTLELLDFIPDPNEPNDEKTDATFWNINQGPVEGYFFEKAHVSRDRADYFRFTAPVTTGGSPVTLKVSNPGAEISIYMNLLNQNGSTLLAQPCTENGQDALLIYTLIPGQDYYIKLFTQKNQTSLQPYQLSMLYVGDGVGSGLTEIEPNNTRETANPWTMEAPFTGVLSTSGDKDYVQIEIPYPGIYSFSVTDVSHNLKVGLYLTRSPSGGTLHYVYSNTRGQSVQLTMDGSAGEQYFLVIHANQWASDGAMYKLSMTGFIPDPGEPNDQPSEATYWDVTEGPIQGYFWEKTHNSRHRADYFRFTAPITEDGSAVSFQVANPAADISICTGLLNHAGSTLLSSQCFPAGENVSLEYFLTGGMDHYIKLSTVDNKTSLQPYTLSMEFIADSDDVPDESSRLVRFHGFVYRQWGLLPLPLANVEIYLHGPGQPALLLGTTNIFGTYSGRVNVADDQQIIIWPEMTDTSFTPETDTFFIVEGLRQHRSVFVLVEEQLVQETPTPTPEVTDTPSPPLIQTELAATPTLPQITASNTPTPPAQQERSTITPFASMTSTETPIPYAEDDVTESTLIIGTIWRLFNTGPAGIGAAEVILSINGLDQPAALSRVDGLYQIEIEGIQPGDMLRLRAQASQDDFEPLFYEWQAERGVNRWEYDFYSYWDEITPPSSQDQNRIWGTVWDQFGGDVSGLYLNLQMGTSDAIQRIGPTDSDGYFEALVTLPDQIMVTVWVDADGYVPSKLMFFHPFDPEDRELIFWKFYGEDIQ